MRRTGRKWRRQRRSLRLLLLLLLLLRLRLCSTRQAAGACWCAGAAGLVLGSTLFPIRILIRRRKEPLRLLGCSACFRRRLIEAEEKKGGRREGGVGCEHVSLLFARVCGCARSLSPLCWARCRAAVLLLDPVLTRGLYPAWLWVCHGGLRLSVCFLNVG